MEKNLSEEKNLEEEHPTGSELRHVELNIDRFQEGRRLDVLLAIRYPALSRSLWQERIRRGEVTVNGRKARPSRILQEGDCVWFSYALRTEPSVNTGFRILFEDDNLLIIDKPPNLPVHASGSYRKNTLNELLMKHFVGKAFICRPVHRLDRETSGIIVYAKSTSAARKITAAFTSGQVKKEYRVLVFGRFPAERICAGRIGPRVGSRIRRKQFYTETAGEEKEDSPASDGVPCRTDFALEQIITLPDGRDVSLLKARLHTGRMHQIRATLCSLGFPVVGDRLYGPDDEIYLRMIHDQETDSDRSLLLLSRSALHCAFMAFPHPTDGQMREFTSPLPPDMILPGV